MRIALLSDIHGNLVALKAVLAALAKEAIDQIICLGDVAPLLEAAKASGMPHAEWWCKDWG